MNCLAFGFGSGLAPIVPGTFGTLPGLLLWLPLSQLHWVVYLVIVAVMGVAGIWICDHASKITEQKDHGAIVWDEIVGYLVTMFLIPFSWTAMVIGFFLFRLFDIVKPWPASWADKKLAGGLGVMLDDVLAGVYCCLCMHVLHRFFPALFMI